MVSCAGKTFPGSGKRLPVPTVLSRVGWLADVLQPSRPPAARPGPPLVGDIAWAQTSIEGINHL